METLAVRIASLTPVTVKGTWLRHSDAGYPERALAGRACRVRALGHQARVRCAVPGRAGAVGRRRGVPTLH